VSIQWNDPLTLALPMNLTPSPHPSPPRRGRGCPPGRVRGNASSDTSFAKQIQQAGADALELNLYNVPTDPNLCAVDLGQHYLNVFKAVRSEVTIPVAVKLSPFFTNFARMSPNASMSMARARWCCSIGFTSRTSNWNRSK